MNKPPANKVISVHTIGIKFLNCISCISQKITPRLQNVFVYYKMYSIPSPHKHFLLNNFYRIIAREKLRGGSINPRSEVNITTKNNHNNN